ncbi:hypothetical protein HK102_003826 [Quaeritorhiza haematococci]|nr:hypothetical protein HK102_003826 [Quaeritorhiza haematococci]
MAAPIRYTAFVSARLDPYIFTSIGIAAYFIHERDHTQDPDKKLIPLLRRRFGFTSTSSTVTATGADAKRSAETSGDDLALLKDLERQLGGGEEVRGKSG